MYTYEKKIKEGGFGSIWLAYDEQNDKKVIIKIDSSSDSHSSYLRHEYNIAHKLFHPHIIRPLYLDETDNTAKLIFDFVESKSVSDVMREGKLFKEEEIFNCLLQITDALAYIHQNGVIHHDISPDNILFDGERFYLIDFGVSVDLNNTENNLNETFVSVPFSGPERFVYMSDFTTKSDVYSLGCTLWFMATGQYISNGQDGIIADIRNDVFINKDLTNLIKLMTQSHESERPSSLDIIKSIPDRDNYYKQYQTNYTRSHNLFTRVTFPSIKILNFESCIYYGGKGSIELLVDGRKYKFSFDRLDYNRKIEFKFGGKIFRAKYIGTVESGSRNNKLTWSLSSFDNRQDNHVIRLSDNYYMMTLGTYLYTQFVLIGPEC